MSAVTTLRRAINVVLTEAEDRVMNVLETTQDAVEVFVSATAAAASAAVRQVVDIAFGLAGTVITEAFNVAEAFATAALGEVEEDGYKSIILDEPIGGVGEGDMEEPR